MKRSFAGTLAGCLALLTSTAPGPAQADVSMECTVCTTYTGSTVVAIYNADGTFSHYETVPIEWTDCTTTYSGPCPDDDDDDEPEEEC